MKRRAGVWLGALAAMTLAACGGDDPSVEPDAGKAPSSDAASSDIAPSDTAPRQRRR